ncbi:hypothetical protein POM88_020268 [Heracleum sosnowskyi]|uniref:Uncharacterized protein n=1 Tax=Heracleum sosnowskyi TaxID=360622 RepID=A0AAD8MSN4_9APIA|nr:hypothetical protein POM88_020268 [Heracleum sosnowskyi]
MIEPNLKLNMMAGNPITEEQDDPREHLFCVKLQVKKSLVDAIVDLGSQKNLIPEALGLEAWFGVSETPKTLLIVMDSQRFWLKRDTTMHIQVIFGSPYLWDRYALYDRRNQKYTFTKDGAQFVIRAVQPPQITNLITKAQAKILVNVCGMFVFSDGLYWVTAKKKRSA